MPNGLFPLGFQSCILCALIVSPIIRVYVYGPTLREATRRYSSFDTGTTLRAGSQRKQSSIPDRTGTGTHPTSYSTGTETVKRLGCESDRSSTSSTEVTNARNSTSIPPAFRAFYSKTQGKHYSVPPQNFFVWP